MNIMFCQIKYRYLSWYTGDWHVVKNALLKWHIGPNLFHLAKYSDGMLYARITC